MRFGTFEVTGDPPVADLVGVIAPRVGRRGSGAHPRRFEVAPGSVALVGGRRG